MRGDVLRLGVICASGSCAGLARRLIQTEDCAWSVTEASPEAGRDILARLVAESDIILTMFARDDLFADAMLGRDGIASLAKSGLRLIDFSPVAPWTFERAAAGLGKAGAKLSGASLGLLPGEGSEWRITVDDDALADPDLRRLVESLSGWIVPAGERGNSKTAGLLERHLHAVSTAVSAEAVSLGKAAGIAPSVLIPLLLKGSGSTEVLRANQRKTTRTANGFEELAELGLRQSNMLARCARHPSWFGAAAADAFRRAAANGPEDAFEKLLGGCCERVPA